MYCPTCGSENPDGAKVCEKCGASLTEDVQNIGNSSMSEGNEVEYSGVFRRILAYVIDCIILSIVGFVIGKIVGYDELGVVMQAASGKIASSQSFIPYSILTLIVTIAYFVLMESSPKQGTLGKMLLGMKITDENGERMSVATASKRYAIFWIFGLITSILSIVAGSPKPSSVAITVTTTIVTLLGCIYRIVIFITMLVAESKQGQGLHDKLSKTYVVNK